jgi:hypothetical protein
MSRDLVPFGEPHLGFGYEQALRNLSPRTLPQFLLSTFLMVTASSSA